VPSVPAVKADPHAGLWNRSARDRKHRYGRIATYFKMSPPAARRQARNQSKEALQELNDPLLRKLIGEFG